MDDLQPVQSEPPSPEERAARLQRLKHHFAQPDRVAGKVRIYRYDKDQKGGLHLNNEGRWVTLSGEVADPEAEPWDVKFGLDANGQLISLDAESSEKEPGKLDAVQPGQAEPPSAEERAAMLERLKHNLSPATPALKRLSIFRCGVPDYPTLMLNGEGRWVTPQGELAFPEAEPWDTNFGVDVSGNLVSLKE